MFTIQKSTEVTSSWGLMKTCNNNVTINKTTIRESIGDWLYTKENAWTELTNFTNSALTKQIHNLDKVDGTIMCTNILWTWTHDKWWAKLMHMPQDCQLRSPQWNHHPSPVTRTVHLSNERIDCLETYGIHLLINPYYHLTCSSG